MQQLHSLEMDDKLIKKQDSGIREMNLEEVRMALVERGVDVMGKSKEQLRASLKAWIKSREKSSVERLLLTRPSAWPHGH